MTAMLAIRFLLAVATVLVAFVVAARIDGTGGIYRLNKPSVAGGIVTELTPTSDAGKVVFRGSVEQAGVFEAYLVPTPDGLRQP